MRKVVSKTVMMLEHKPERKNQPYDLIGNAIIVERLAKFFFVTAKHTVATNTAEKIYCVFPHDPRPFQFPKVVGLVGDDGLPPDNTLMDVAVFPIPDEILSRYQELSKLVVDYTVLEEVREPVDQGQFVVAGYPRSKFKMWNENINSEAIAYRAAEISAEEYKEMGVSHSKNLVFNYSKKEVYSDGSIRQGPNPYGLSGSPVWRITNGALLREYYLHQPKLAGIFFGCLDGRIKVAGVRAWIILHMIEEILKKDEQIG